MNYQIQNKINELYESTPQGVGVGFGTKITNGEYTNESCIVFTVEKKLPEIELSEELILPKEIIIDNITYKTDVLEVGKIEPFQWCNPAVPNIDNNCYGWISTPPQNRQTIRPLRGGISLSSYSHPNTVGTLGFLALDISTNGLVGVTNNHVVIGDALYTSERNLAGSLQNEISDNSYQTGEFGPQSNLVIGQVVRYVPLLKETNPSGNPQYNQVDGALISINSSVVDANSYRILGLSGTTPMPFATTAELDNLLGNQTLASSGRSSGVKQGPNCGLTPYSINLSVYVGPYPSQNSGNYNVNYNNCIGFTRLSPGCAYPIYPGDSGSVLIAQIGGIDKIIGLCFAGSTYFGVASRIDQVAAQLGIKPWLGLTPSFINPSTIKPVTQSGGSSQKTLICNGKTLWQVGLTNQTYTC